MHILLNIYGYSIEIRLRFYRNPIEILWKFEFSPIEMLSKFDAHSTEPHILLNRYGYSIEIRLKPYRASIESISKLDPRSIEHLSTEQIHQSSIYRASLTSIELVQRFFCESTEVMRLPHASQRKEPLKIYRLVPRLVSRFINFTPCGSVFSRFVSSIFS